MKRHLAALAAVLAVAGAQAQGITATDLHHDYYDASYSDAYSVHAFSPWDATPDLGLKTQDGFTGVGVQGMTDGEIDWRDGQSERITVTFAQATRIDALTLGLLFNGPEYNDVREVASIRLNGDSHAYTLRTTGTDNTARWYYGSTLLGSFAYVVGGGTQLGEAGAITLANPFGDRMVSRIRFGAEMGSSGGGCADGACLNQSDYNVVGITPAVPEPETYALMLAGLGALAFVTRRRRAQAR